MLEVANIVGIVGVILVLLTYFLLQVDRIKSESLSYSLMNMISSMLILYSFYYEWNLPAALVEISWLAISIFGVLKWVVQNKKTNLKMRR